MKPDSHEGIWHRIDRVCDKVVYITSIIFIAPCAVLLVAWVFMFGAFIISRTIFNTNWLFVEEYTEYWLVLIVFFSLLYTLRKGGHINVDTVVKLLSKKTRNILALITAFLSLVLVCYLTSKGVAWFQYGLAEGVRSLTPLNTLVWPVYLLIPIGLAALSLGLLIRFFRLVMWLVWAKDAEAINGEN